MTSFLTDLQQYIGNAEDLVDISSILDRQVTGLFGTIKYDDAANEWSQQRLVLETYMTDGTDEGLAKAIKAFSKIIDAMDLYTPTLKGLQDIHGYTCESLETIIFECQAKDQTFFAAALLYGQAMAMSPMTESSVSTAVENLLLKKRRRAVDLSICILLGVERSSINLFESNLPLLLRQVQIAAEKETVSQVAQEALVHAMKIYSPSERVASCQAILKTTHRLLESSLNLCADKPALRSRNMDGLLWCCFLVEHTPMLLRQDLINQYPKTCNAEEIFRTLALRFKVCNPDQKAALCGALPVLATWSTSAFYEGDQIERMIDFMYSVVDDKKPLAMEALGRIAAVILNKFEPFLPKAGALALDALREGSGAEEQRAAQYLLGKLLSAMGPITIEIMIGYLRCSPDILLMDVGLLQLTARLVPNLASRITAALVNIVDDVLERSDPDRQQAVLEALSMFPFDDPSLLKKTQKLVLSSLKEEKGNSVVMAALLVAMNQQIATPQINPELTTKVALLLLAEDAHIVHMGLGVLSNPSLSSKLDEKSCSMILLALHQSLEPSIQIVAAKLLTATHRAIVQPLAWSHIRQSLNLMDFLKNVDRTRAIVEACIISNLLPALPPALHRKYVGPVKELILAGLASPPNEGNTLSLIFQGLANLAKLEQWGSAQQEPLVLGLLEMSQEIPKDSQHAALNAISRLLSVPQEGLDVYEILIAVHATFGGRSSKLDSDLKALVSGIYGHLGTVERNPAISRDSKAAINRETSLYTPKTKARSEVAEVRDKSGAHSQTHINCLVTKTLKSALKPSYRASEDRALVLEIMTALGLLQPQEIPQLIPDLPELILKEITQALKAPDSKRDLVPITDSALFLAAALHISPQWMNEYWTVTAEVMAKCIEAGESMAVLQGLEIILSAGSENES